MHFCLFLNYLQKKSYFFHNEKDIILSVIDNCSVSTNVIHVFVTLCVLYSIPNIETIPQICSLTVAKV